MKPLVKYYSRTGYTKQVADILSKELKGDLEEIIDTKKRKGVMGWLLAGRDAQAKKSTNIKEISKEIASYDLVILGTPVWAWTAAVPTMTFLNKYKEQLNKVAFFLTCGGNPKNTFDDMTNICNKKPICTLELTRQDFKDGSKDKKSPNGQKN